MSATPEICWSYKYTCNLPDVDSEFCGAFMAPDDEAQARAIARVQLDIKEEQHHDGLGGNRLRPNPKFQLSELKKAKIP
jgi:hypothetical protein